MSFKVKTDLKWKMPKVDFRDDLKKIARKIVIPSLKEGILTDTDITGRSYPGLSAATIRRKRHSRPLQDEGILLNSFKSKTAGQSVIIYIDSARRKIAEFLQVDGVGKARKKFRFMGVTEGMERDANKYMKNVIIKWVRNANK